MLIFGQRAAFKDPPSLKFHDRTDINVHTLGSFLENCSTDLTANLEFCVFFIFLPVYEFYFSFVVAAFCQNNHGQRIQKNEFGNLLSDPLMSLFTSNCYLK